MIDVPWWQAIEVVCGLFTGFVYARTAHLFKILHERGHKSHCAWCGGHLVDLRDPGAQDSMRQHISSCSARTAVTP
jgi:hypothetical protein